MSILSQVILTGTMPKNIQNHAIIYINKINEYGPIIMSWFMNIHERNYLQQNIFSKYTELSPFKK